VPIGLAISDLAFDISERRERRALGLAMLLPEGTAELVQEQADRGGDDLAKPGVAALPVPMGRVSD
jgi:hypothetical protein